MRTNVDIVVVGAGPAGSTAAILLARAGLAVALVERQPFPRRKVCGECIAASNLPLLDALGIGGAFAARAGPELRQVALMRGESCVVADLPSAPRGPHWWGRALGRETLDALLLEQAQRAGAQVLQPWRVGAIAPARARAGARVALHAGRRTLLLQAPVVVAANGCWAARACTDGACGGTARASDLFAFKANYRDASLAAGLLPVLSFAGGYGGMVVADGGIATVACCVRRDRLLLARQAAPGAPAGEAIERMLIASCSGVRDALRTASRVGAWIGAGPLDPGVHFTRSDTQLRIGNAAGEAHPIIGEGISMAIQSGFLLSSRLLDAFGRAHVGTPEWREQLVGAHARQWRRAFRGRLLLAATFAHAAMRPASSAALLALIAAWPQLLTRGARWGGKTASVAEPLAASARALCDL
jgi:flavin-dependent dehydrogenase